MVEGKLHEGDESVPQVEGEGDVESGKGGDDVVFGCADVSLCKISSMVIWCDKLYNTGGGEVAEKMADRFGRLVVRDEVGDGVVM